MFVSKNSVSRFQKKIVSLSPNIMYKVTKEMREYAALGPIPLTLGP